MPKCQRCGKKGFFLRLSDKSLCPDCALIRKKADEELERLRKENEDMIREIEETKEMLAQAKDEIYEQYEAPYRELQEKHRSLLEKISIEYALVSNSSDFDDERIDHIIDLCKDDIALLGPYKKALKGYYTGRKKLKQAYEKIIRRGDLINDLKPKDVNSWESYKRLALIYEKQKRYEDALNICLKAINQGITKDGSSAGMIGRAARLAKKDGKELPPSLTESKEESNDE